MANYLLTNLNTQNYKDILNLDSDINIDTLFSKSFLQKLGVKHAIIYNIDSVYAGNIDYASIDKEKLIEARFFNEVFELKIWKNGNDLIASYFKELDNPEYVEESYFLYKDVKSKEAVNKIKVRKYLDYDDENQCYISYLKPMDFIFEREWLNESWNNGFRKRS